MSKQLNDDGSLGGCHHCFAPPPTSGHAISVEIERNSGIDAKVNLWLETQHTHIRFDGFGPMRPYRSVPFLVPEPKSNQKKVHWTPNVRDNEKPPSKLKEKAKKSPIPTQKRRSPSISKPGRAPPMVPEPPRSRAPPSTPTPRRLPTPDLLDLKHNAFCTCCKESPPDKMKAQMIAATHHIAAARYQMAASKQMVAANKMDARQRQEILHY